MSPRYRLFPAALLILPTVAYGYAFTTATPDGTIHQNQQNGQPIIWDVPQQSFTFNFGGNYDVTAKSAADEWNSVNTPLQYQSGASGAQTCVKDGYNSAGWSSLTCDNQPFGDAIAVTKRTFINVGNRWYLNETDIALDQSRNWQIYTGKIQPGVQDFHRVILHELGHALGLDHPDEAGQTVTAIMNSRTSDIDTLQDDDKNGVSSLYSGGTTGNSSSNSANQTSGSSGGGGGGADFAITVFIIITRAIRRMRNTSRPADARAGD